MVKHEWRQHKTLQHGQIYIRIKDKKNLRSVLLTSHYLMSILFYIKHSCHLKKIAVSLQLITKLKNKTLLLTLSHTYTHKWKHKNKHVQLNYVEEKPENWIFLFSGNTLINFSQRESNTQLIQLSLLSNNKTLTLCNIICWLEEQNRVFPVISLKSFSTNV